MRLCLQQHPARGIELEILNLWARLIPQTVPSIMKPLIALIPAALLLISCDRMGTTVETSDATKKTTFASPEPKWAETDYTRWMSQAELQYQQDLSDSDQYFAFVEGRNNHGISEYRAVKRDLLTTQYSQWAVFWGIDDKELFDWELRLLKSGFERKSRQVFFDSTGKAIHQIVWLRPTGAIDNLPEVEVAKITPQPIVPEVEKLVEIEDPLKEPAEVVDVPKVEEPKVEEPAPLAAIVPEPKIEKKPVTELKVEEEPAPKAEIVYDVKPGDTLGRIAAKYKTTVSALKKKNGLKNDILRIGQKLKLP